MVAIWDDRGPGASVLPDVGTIALLGGIRPFHPFGLFAPARIAGLDRLRLTRSSFLRLRCACHPLPPNSSAEATPQRRLRSSDAGKPQAGLFSESQASLAKKAAKQLGLTALTLSTADLAKLKTKIPAGRLYANRRSFIPAARRDVHQKLVEFAKSGSGGSGSRGART